jgi:hypothetical protein
LSLTWRKDLFLFKRSELVAIVNSSPHFSIALIVEMFDGAT